MRSLLGDFNGKVSDEGILCGQFRITFYRKFGLLKELEQ
jgi:hypothetical protein